MKLNEAREVITTIPKEHHATLAAALERYWRFAGMYGFDQPDVRTLADRAAFPHLLGATEDGKPVASDASCAAFMASVTGLPWAWCRAWDEVDFMDTHGVLSAEEELMRVRSA